MQPGMRLGTGGASPIKSDLDKAQFMATPPGTVEDVDAVNMAPKESREPPEKVLASFDAKQRAAFMRLWRRCRYPCTRLNLISRKRYGRRPILAL